MNELPSEIVSIILSHLNYIHLAKCKRINKKFKEASESQIQKLELTCLQRDLALKRPATSSGTFPANCSIEDPIGTADKAVDGKENSRWSGHPPETAWITVDLGDVYVLRAMDIKFEAAYASLFRLQTSLDGNTWAVVGNYCQGREGWCYYAAPTWTHLGNRKIIQETMLKSQTDHGTAKARYIKLQLVRGRSYGWGMSIFHLKVYGL